MAAKVVPWPRVGAVLGVVVFAAAILLWAVEERLFGVDFGVFHLAGSVVGSEGYGELYDPERFQRRLAADYYPSIGSDGRSLTYFISTPPFAWVMQAMAWIPFRQAFVLWTVAGFGALVASVRLLGLPMRAALLAAAMPAVVYNTVLGQSGLLFLLLAALVHRCAASDREFRAGLVAGLFILKPPLAVGLAIWWLLDLRRWWKAVVAAAGSAVLVSLPTLVGGPAPWRAFSEVLTGRVEDEANWNVNSMSIAEFLKLLAPNNASLTLVFWALAALAGVVAMALSLLRWSGDTEVLSAAAMLVTVGVSPHLSIYDTTLLLIPIAVVVRRLPDGRHLAECVAAVYAMTLALAPAVYSWQFDVAGRGIGLELPGLVVITYLLTSALGRGDSAGVDRVGQPEPQPQVISR